MSFAIIETGGKQYKVSASKILEIEKLDAKIGETIKFQNVLLLNDDTTTEVGNPSVDGAMVEAKLLDNVKDRTVLIFHKRRRKHSRKKRQGWTLTNKSIDAAQLTGTVANARLDAELQALAGLTSAANKGIEFTGSGSAGTYDLTAAGKALLDDANAAAQRSTLGLGSAAVLTAGTSANNAVQLDGSARLPAVDGSQLTNLPAAGATAGFAVAMAIAL